MKFHTFYTMDNKEGKYLFGVAKVGERGQIVIPKEARDLYDIKPGDTLMLMGDKNGMAMVKTELFASLVEKVVDEITEI